MAMVTVVQKTSEFSSYICKFINQNKSSPIHTCLLHVHYNLHGELGCTIGNCRNVRRLGKSTVVFRLFGELIKIN